MNETEVKFWTEVRCQISDCQSEDDQERIDCAIIDFYEKGWFVSEVASYLRNMEEVNPELAEDVALRNMKRISDLVKLRKERGKI